MRIFRELLLHISVVCCLVSVITKVLDWYNPYMDFSGHVWYVQALLYVSVRNQQKSYKFYQAYQNKNLLVEEKKPSVIYFQV